MGGALEVALERVEAPGEFLTVRFEPFVEFTKGFDAQAIQPALGILANLDEAGVAQHLEVTGDAGLVHPDLLDQLADGPLTAADGIEDVPPCRFGDHLEDGEL